MRNLMRQLTPFLFICLAVLLFGFGLMLFAYLFIFAVIVGSVLYVANWIQRRFLTPPKKPAPRPKNSGRVIDSDDWHRMP